MVTIGESVFICIAPLVSPWNPASLPHIEEPYPFVKFCSKVHSGKFESQSTIRPTLSLILPRHCRHFKPLLLPIQLLTHQNVRPFHRPRNACFPSRSRYTIGQCIRRVPNLAC